MWTIIILIASHLFTLCVGYTIGWWRSPSDGGGGSLSDIIN